MSSKLNEFAWIDDGGALHLNIPEMLKKMNVADTDANREEATRTAMLYLQRELPQSLVIVTDSEGGSDGRN
jgi:hypothetical protein